MDADMVADQVRDVLAHAFGIAHTEIGEGMSPTTLAAWTSLHHFTLIAALEDEFKVTYASDEIPQMTSVPAIVDATMRHLQGAVAH